MIHRSGVMMSTSSPDGHAQVIGDLPCLTCGYNLRTLSTNANCPECGNPVSQTLRNTLWLADPVWLKRVRRDVDLLILMSIFLVGTVTQPYDFWPISMWDWWWGNHPVTAFLGPTVVAVYIAGVFHFTGWKGPSESCDRRYAILLPSVFAATFLLLVLDYALETYGIISEMTLLLCMAAYPALPIIVAAKARILANQAGRRGIIRVAGATIWIGRATLATLLTILVLGRLEGWHLIRTAVRWEHPDFLQEVVCSIFIPVLGLTVVLMLLVRRELTRTIRVAKKRPASLEDA